ncbi:unnamed protein product [Pieris brassicae]|uniref:Uncharacterized protein n=1 Tax=Pieris brassicae TaxID=7116 RepID=A0A9P0XH33_PIEBR|nr:unnamed protein product [Pieris brassicae]
MKVFHQPSNPVQPFPISSKGHGHCTTLRYTLDRERQASARQTRHKLTNPHPPAKRQRLNNSDYAPPFHTVRETSLYPPLA